MILLKDTTETLKINTTSTANIDYSVSWVDVTTTDFSPSTSEGKITTATSLEKNSDGSTKKYIAVGQAVCNEGDSIQSGKVLFVAVQSYDSITWEGSYVAPSKLPKYIFNTDPALYNRKFNNPATF